MNRGYRTLARLCSSMWIGAAFLFVTTSVTEQVHPAITPATKDLLALIRFPWYYGTGATLLAIAIIAAWFSVPLTRPGITAVLLLLAAAAIMVADYLLVYRPLREVMAEPGSGHGVTFDRLHTWSERLNTTVFLLSTAAAVILCAAREHDVVPAHHS